MRTHLFSVLTLAATSLMGCDDASSTSTLDAIAIGGTKVSICHWTDSTTNEVVIIDISENAVDTHLGHGDQLAYGWYADADGDGYAETGAAELDCPGSADGSGYTQYAIEGDCDDDSADVSPAAEEVCDDGIDNNCDGQIDEGCNACPCADAWEAMDPSTDLDLGYCFENESVSGIYSDATYVLGVDYTTGWGGQLVVVEWEDATWSYTGEETECLVFDVFTGDVTPEAVNTADEFADCEELILDYADAAGLTCN